MRGVAAAAAFLLAAGAVLLAGDACRSEGQTNAALRYRVAYATYLGGREFDQGREAIVYPDGSVLVGGETASADFPTTPGVVQPRYAGDDPALGPSGVYGGDCFLCRLAPDGGKLLFSTFFGGSKQERNVYGMDLDRQGNIVFCSMTRSADLPTTPGCFQPKFGGGPTDWFAAKLTPDGRRTLWCTYVGGSGDESPRGGLALDAQDDVYLVGTTQSRDFPVTPGAYQTRHTGPASAAVVKLKPDGSGLVFSTLLGGSGGGDGVMGARVGADGQVTLTGHTQSADFPVTGQALQPKVGGKSDCWLGRLSADGAGLAWCTYLGGSQNEFAEHRVWLDPDGTAILTGVTASPDFPTTEKALQRSLRADNTGFIAAVAPDGHSLRFSTLLGGTGGGFFLMPTRLPGGEIAVVGTTTARDFPVTRGALQATYGGGAGDGVLAILSPDGSRLLYATYLGGTGDDLVRTVAMGPRGELYLSGSTTSPDFPTTGGAFQRKLGGQNDAFVVKLVPEAIK